MTYKPDRMVGIASESSASNTKESALLIGMRVGAISIALMSTITALGWWSTPAAFSPQSIAEPQLPNNVEDWISQRESIADKNYGLTPGTEQRIRWQTADLRTEYAIIYIHGFSATRQEIAPTVELVADELGANLLDVRLDGHGHETQPMHNVSAEGWVQNVVNALAIGVSIGHRLIVISTSTGATLTMAAIETPQMKKVESLVMISPNWHLNRSTQNASSG